MLKSLLASSVAAAALLALAPGVAHADANSDFLGCLANHHVTYTNKDATLEVFHRLQARLSGSVTDVQLAPYQLVYANLTEAGLDAPTAKGVAECEMAATLMGGH